MGNNDIIKPDRRKFITIGAKAAMTGLAGLSVLTSASGQNAESSNSNSKKDTIIDGHSHMLMGSYGPGIQKRKVEDLKEINLQNLFNQMDDMGIEMFVSVVQETMRIWKDWTGTNELIIDLQEKYPERFIGIFGAEPLNNRNVFNKQR